MIFIERYSKLDLCNCQAVSIKAQLQASLPCYSTLVIFSLLHLGRSAGEFWLVSKQGVNGTTAVRCFCCLLILQLMVKP